MNDWSKVTQCICSRVESGPRHHRTHALNHHCPWAYNQSGTQVPSTGVKAQRARTGSQVVGERRQLSPEISLGRHLKDALHVHILKRQMLVQTKGLSYKTEVISKNVVAVAND